MSDLFRENKEPDLGVIIISDHDDSNESSMLSDDDLPVSNK